MLQHKILENSIAVIEPSGPLSENDFEALGKTVDAYLAESGRLNGLLIHTRDFPGWEDFEGFIEHIKFVHEHQSKINKVALVSNSVLASIAPKLASHFVAAEIRQFDFDLYDEAMDWLQS